MQHAHTMCTISFMVEYLSKVWWHTVTHTFFATFELFLQIVFRCFDVFWFGSIDFAFEVITVPTTYVNETRYSFRLNVTVAELQDMKNQRPGKLMSSFTPAPSPFPCCGNGNPMRDNRCCLELESNPKSRLSDSWISKCIQTALWLSSQDDVALQQSWTLTVLDSRPFSRTLQCTNGICEVSSIP